MAQFHSAKRRTWPVFVRRVTLAQPTVNLLSPAARHPRPTPPPPAVNTDCGHIVPPQRLA